MKSEIFINLLETRYNVKFICWHPTGVGNLETPELFGVTV